MDAALRFLQRARRAFEDAGYEVQAVRVATSPLPPAIIGSGRDRLRLQLRALDQLVGSHGASLSIGPVAPGDDASGDAGTSLAEWLASLVASTRTLSCSIPVTRPGRVPDLQAAALAATVIARVAATTPGGDGNFRFAAAANIPAGTPFFPVAYHEGPTAFAVGLESAGLVMEAFSGTDAERRMRELFDTELARVEQIATRIADREGRRFLGIDASPAPGLDRSIGEAIERLTGTPFGHASTLTACALITDVLKTLRVKTCGYSGLMLPVLEDPVLARRAAEGTYGVKELLLYSSVCGTGLDLVPLPGDTPVERMTALIGDVAALAAKWRKPLSARLFPVPGATVGSRVHVDHPYLTDSVAMRLD